MYDQSFCRKTLERVLWKRDFRKLPAAMHKAFRETILANATASAASHFNAPSVPLSSFPLRGKLVYRPTRPEYELVIRKLSSNLKHCMSTVGEGRSQIVANLRLILAEGVPYRIYRLDVRSFYESFQKHEVQIALNELRALSPQSRGLIASLLDSHAATGGIGLPRGLSLSAILSEILMRRFDEITRANEDVFYYSRYVDDIIIVTSGREKAGAFVASTADSLPLGLALNPDKRKIVEAPARVAKAAATSASPRFSFDYLGYSFTVRDPTVVEAGKKKAGELERVVSLDIANRKLKKLKTRIVRSFLDYCTNTDWELLRDRISLLTQNFSVYNPKAGGKKLAGIYHSYPLVNVSSNGLLELDRFLRNAVLSRTGRIFSISSTLLTGTQKRQLLKLSFARGHDKHSFVHFSGQRISEIQRCWVN